MFFKLNRERHCCYCLTAILNQCYKCLRCRRSVCFQCSQESFEGSEHSRSHPMQLLTNRRHSDFIIGAQPYPYMMATKFTCPICCRMDFDNRGLVLHIEHNHNGNNELVYCPICIATPNSSNASRVWNLWDHMRLHHMQSGNREPLMSPWPINEVDESDETFYRAPHNSPAEDNEYLIFFNEQPTNIVASNPAAIGADNIFDQMETDLADYVEPTNDIAQHNAVPVVVTNRVSLTAAQHTSNQVPMDISNDANMDDDISSSAYVSPYEVSHQAFVASSRFSRRGISVNGIHGNSVTPFNRIAGNRRTDEVFPPTNGLRFGGNWERRLRGFRYNGVASRTMPMPGHFVRTDVPLNNVARADNIDNDTFVLPRLWPQYAQEEVTMARAIAHTTEAIDSLTEHAASYEPSQSNNNNNL